MSSTAVTRHVGMAPLRRASVRAISVLGLARLVVVGLPLAFVVVSWIAADGYPYYLDNNESILHFVVLGTPLDVRRLYRNTMNFCQEIGGTLTNGAPPAPGAQ